MRLLLFTLVVVVVVVVVVAVESDVKFDEARPFVLLPSIRNVTFRSRSGVPESTQYPLGVEAVLSVALKVQQVFQGRSSVPRNFLVSPIAVAGALGQLMLGSRGELRKQLGALLTLRNSVQSRLSEVPWSNPDVLDAVVPERVSSATVLDSRANSQAGGRIRVRNMLDHRTQAKIKMPTFSATRKDGLPGLELHRQLGGLIKTLSNPLQSPGVDLGSLARPYLHMASAFFVNRDLEVNEQFVRAIIDFYDASLIPVNFSGNSAESQRLVNEWGSMQTGGLIKDFLKLAPRPDTAVQQLVAIHFRGAWEIPFVRQGTIAGYFKTSEETKVPVNLMRGSLEDVPYAESERLGLRMVAIPYVGLECAMYVLLPNDDNPLKYEVGNIVTSLDERDIKELIDSTKLRTVNVMFPRLSLTSSLNLASALRKHAAYANNDGEGAAAAAAAAAAGNVSVSREEPSMPTQSANLNSSSLAVDLRPVASAREPSGRALSDSSIDRTERIVPSPDNIVFSSRTQGADDRNYDIILSDAAPSGLFRVSDMIQEIVLEMNEAGTEAAAISGSTVNYSGFVKNLKVDRPFIFFIRQEETKALLFWGTVVDPSS